MGSKEISKSMVENLRKSNFVVALISYNTAPNNTLEGMIDEVKSALRYFDNWAAQRGSRGLYIAGHSAGAHLLYMSYIRMQSYSFRSLKGIILLAGVYNMDYGLYNPNVWKKIK